MDKYLIGIYEVSDLFGLSIEAIRKYKILGLIEPFKRVGRKDLFIKEDIILRRNLIDSLKGQGKSLQEIAKIINAAGQGQNLGEHHPGKKISKILIIEDERPIYDVILKYLKKSFSKNALEVFYAKDGLGGIREAERINPGIIIIDVTLPILSGIEVYKQVFKNPRISDAKFVFMSGSIKFEPEGTIFIQKPFELPEFIKLIENLTGLQASMPSSLMS